MMNSALFSETTCVSCSPTSTVRSSCTWKSTHEARFETLWQMPCREKHPQATFVVPAVEECANQHPAKVCSFFVSFLKGVIFLHSWRTLLQLEEIHTNPFMPGAEGSVSRHRQQKDCRAMHQAKHPAKRLGANLRSIELQRLVKIAIQCYPNLPKTTTIHSHVRIWLRLKYLWNQYESFHHDMSLH